MNHIKTIKIAAASALLSVLVACGGGGAGEGAGPGEAGAPEPKFNNAAWSSPGVFVPAEQASTKLALGRCLRNQEEALFNANLVIASNGDMSITAAASEAEGAAVSTVFEMPFESKLTAWGVSGTVQSPTFYILGIHANEEQTPTKLLLASMGDGLNNVLLEQGQMQPKLIAGENTEEGSTSIQCETVQTPVIHAKLGNARAAQHFGAAAGINDVDDSVTDVAIIDNKAFWQKGGDLGGMSSDEFRFLRFDMATGELAANATGAEGSTYTPISTSLPQANGEGTVQGIYGEMSCRNTFAFGALAKFIFVALIDSAENGKSFAINAFTYDNVLAPNRSISDCFNGSIGPGEPE